MTMEPPQRLEALVDLSSASSDEDSLFDEPQTRQLLPVAQRTAPHIPGFYFSPDLLPPELAEELFYRCYTTYFTSPSVNQIMLFGLASSSSSCLPSFLRKLLDELKRLLQPLLPPEVHQLLFRSDGARQAIINMYEPGEGITPHVDLLRRFGDGIIGVSLGGSCVMRFREAVDTGNPETTHDLFLPARSVIVLTGDARYKWTHGIEARSYDRVEGESDFVERDLRINVTFRWLLPGADIVGKD